RRRQQKPVAAVERLGPEARGPVDEVLDHARHGGVVLGRGDDEGVALEEAAAQLVRAGWDAVGLLDVPVEERDIEVAHGGEVDGGAVGLGGARGEPDELTVERLGAERGGEGEDLELGLRLGHSWSMPGSTTPWPALPLADWRDTKETLHRYA